MVRNRQRKTDRGGKGAQVQEAARVMIRDGKPLMQAARQFDVSRNCLRKYVKKWRANLKAGNPDPPHFGYKGKNHQVFTDEQEQVFVASLFQAANPCYYFTPKEVRRFAYVCANANHLKFPPGWSNKGMAGADWFWAFKKRHGGLVELPWGKAKGTSQTNAINWTMPILPCRPTPPGVLAEPKVSSETSQQSPPFGEQQSSEASQSGLPPELDVPYEISQSGTPSVGHQSSEASQSSTPSVEHQSSESTPSVRYQSSEASHSGDLNQITLSPQSTMSGPPQLDMPSEMPQIMSSEIPEPKAPCETPQPSIPVTHSSYPEVHISDSNLPSGVSQPCTSSATFPTVKVEDTLFKRVKSRKQAKPKRTTPLPQKTTPSHHAQHPIDDHPTFGKPELGFLIPPLALQINGIIPPVSPVPCAIDAVPIACGEETSTVPRPNVTPVSLHKASQCISVQTRAASPKCSRNWSNTKELNIPDGVVQNFEQMDIDGELFVDLTDEMLDELEVSKLHRLIIHKFRKGWRPHMT